MHRREPFRLSLHRFWFKPIQYILNGKLREEVGKRHRPNIPPLAQREHLSVVTLLAESRRLGIEVGVCTKSKHHTVFRAATTN